jgi:hypothetical protein
MEVLMLVLWSLIIVTHAWAPEAPALAMAPPRLRLCITLQKPAGLYLRMISIDNFQYLNTVYCKVFLTDSQYRNPEQNCLFWACLCRLQEGASDWLLLLC